MNKTLISLYRLFLTLFLFIGSTHAIAQPQVKELKEVLRQYYDGLPKTHRVANLDLNYSIGGYPKSIGYVSLMVEEDKSGELTLKLQGEISALGHDVKIDSELSHCDLKNGEALKFYLPGQDESFIEIAPGENFSSDGGDFTIWFRGKGRGWRKEQFALQNVGGKFRLFQKNPNYYQMVKKIKVVTKGMSLDSLSVDEFTPST